MISPLKPAVRHTIPYFLLLFSCVILFFSLISCEKGVEEPEIPEEERQLERINRELSFSNFIVDKDILDQIYVGNILKVEKGEDQPELRLTALKNYTKLPIRMLSLNELPVKTKSEIPSFLSTQTYAQNFENYDLGYNRLVESGWYSIVDFDALILPFGYQPDIKELIKEHRNPEAKDGKVDPEYAVLVSYQKQETLTIMMELPNEEELLSPEEERAVLADDPSLCYINTISYGRAYMLVVKSLDTAENVSMTMKALLGGENMTDRHVETLEKSTLLVYLCTGNNREKLLLEGSGVEGISKVVSEFVEEYENTDNQYAYPVSFTMRHLGNFGLFKHTFSYEWYVEKDAND